jgi:trimethylamine:corrinoid methyltransferase-like protein
VRLYLQEAVDVLRQRGTGVTGGNLVRIPSGLVEWALATVPKRVTLATVTGSA